MKKNFIIPSILFMMLVILSPSFLNAADISVGATTWYSKWETPKSWGFEIDDPTFLYGPIVSAKINNDFNFTFESFLYGPIVSAKINNDFNFTFVFLYGQFKETADFGTDNVEIPVDVKINRYDSDTALNYKLNNYLKLFAGLKFMKYSYTVKGDITGIDESVLYNIIIDADVNHTGYGPGGGISGVFPLGHDFYLLANISLMYIWGKQKGTNETEVFYLDDLYSDYNSYTKEKVSEKYKEYGYNTGASVAYYISGASTTISLGGRYQAYTTEYTNSDFKNDKDKNKFWGATLSATYSFSI